MVITHISFPSLLVLMLLYIGIQRAITLAKSSGLLFLGDIWHPKFGGKFQILNEHTESMGNSWECVKI